MKNWEKGFGFLDNCIWIACKNFSLAVNMLTNSPMISNETKRDVF